MANPTSSANAPATPLARRLLLALSELDNPPKHADLARIAGVKPPSVHDWFNGKTKSLGKALLPVAKELGVNPEWLNTGRGPMRHGSNAALSSTPVRMYVNEQPWTYGDFGPIELTSATGSCGGGSISWEVEDRQPLLKEPSWFQRYRVKSSEIIAVFADGDSMADFIVDGDIVLFNRAKTSPRSGVIFLIDHPDGLKIKRLRRDIDGSWVLESNNPDKRRFPDERIEPEQADLLKIVGEFFYRQGG